MRKRKLSFGGATAEVRGGYFYADGKKIYQRTTGMSAGDYYIKNQKGYFKPMPITRTVMGQLKKELIPFKIKKRK